MGTHTESAVMVTNQQRVTYRARPCTGLASQVKLRSMMVINHMGGVGPCSPPSQCARARPSKESTSQCGGQACAGRAPHRCGRHSRSGGCMRAAAPSGSLDAGAARRAPWDHESARTRHGGGAASCSSSHTQRAWVGVKLCQKSRCAVSAPHTPRRHPRHASMLSWRAACFNFSGCSSPSPCMHACIQIGLLVHAPVMLSWGGQGQRVLAALQLRP